MRLGRTAADPRSLNAAPKHLFGAVLPSPRVDRSRIDIKPLLGRNDIYPDCTCVSRANLARGIAHLNSYELVVDEALLPAAYASVVGVDNTPEAIQATEGAQMLAVATWEQTQGGYDIGPQKLVGITGTLGNNRIDLAHAIDRLGGAWIGVRLYERDMETALTGDVWDIREGRDDGALVGGHALNMWGYDGLPDNAATWVGTWGRWKGATWAWVINRLDEAHAVVWRQLARTDGGFYDGLTADGLVAEL